MHASQPMRLRRALYWLRARSRSWIWLAARTAEARLPTNDGSYTSFWRLIHILKRDIARIQPGVLPRERARQLYLSTFWCTLGCKHSLIFLAVPQCDIFHNHPVDVQEQSINNSVFVRRLTSPSGLLWCLARISSAWRVRLCSILRFSIFFFRGGLHNTRQTAGINKCVAKHWYGYKHVGANNWWFNWTANPRRTAHARYISKRLLAVSR